jgi:indolepyruvate ferredoxin oxidoreductase
MTGGQMPAGQQTIPDLCQSLLGEGVKQVAVVTDEIDRYTTSVRRDLPPGVIVHDRSQLEKVEVEFAKVLGVTAIIYDQACSNELRRLRKREVVPDRKKRIVINEAVCEGCGDCGVKKHVSFCAARRKSARPQDPNPSRLLQYRLFMP